MPTSSVADRIAEIKTIFADFGIQIYPNSTLDIAIKSEFGSGKRSALNKILVDLNQDTDAAILAQNIGQALEREMQDPEIVVYAKLLQQRLPSLFRILDTRQQTNKRLHLLEQFIQHFEHKLADKQDKGTTIEQLDRLQRMLAGTRQQLQNQVTIQAVGSVVEEFGFVFDLREVKRCGKVLQIVTPVLIALDQADLPNEQKINHCVRALAALGQELCDPKMTKVAKILDNVHWLAKISLPKVPEQATIEQALQNINIPIGSITTQQIRNKAQAAGLNEKEIIQILYHNKLDPRVSGKDQNLIDATHKNQQYAAACGYVTQLGQDLACKELEQIGIAGICLASMRQTYCELKTNNLNIINFSESLGLILTTAGTLTGNNTMTKIGKCVLDGVQTYAGIMAIPGAQAIAIPLAVCATLTKMVLSTKAIRNKSANPTPEIQLHHIYQQVSMLHTDMRRQFSHLFKQLEAQHLQLLDCLDKGFSCILNYTQHCHILNIVGLQNIERKLDLLQYNLNKGFIDLYLEHIYEPIQEIEYYNKYQPESLYKLHDHQHKLSMWLLYKSKNRKANGLELIMNLEGSEEFNNQLNMILQKSIHHDAVLGLINRYLNIEFKQTLPEDLPHMPSWLIAAETLTDLINHLQENPAREAQQEQLLQDIIATGEQIINYLHLLANNQGLWLDLTLRTSNLYMQIKDSIYKTINDINPNSFKSLDGAKQTAAEAFENRRIYAQPAPVEQQIEAFEPIEFDITHLWHSYLSVHIPQELYLASAHGLGQIHIHYVLDPHHNGFANLRLAHNYGLLPDAARDVIFRIDVSFRLKGENVNQLLISGFFAHDLHTAQRRFEEYYQPKFKHALRHKRYLWISLDGRQNQVVNNGDTDTTKIIDHSRVAQIYYTWWQNAQPISSLEIQLRLQQNSIFMSRYASVVNQGSCVNLQTDCIRNLKSNLMPQLQQLIIAQRASVSATLLESKVLVTLFEKLDTYMQVNTILSQFMHISTKRYRLQSEFKQLLVTWSEPQNWQLDYSPVLEQLLSPPVPSELNFDYEHGELYLKLKICLDNLQLLRINTQVQHLQSTLHA